MELTPLDPPHFEGEEAIEVLSVWLDRDERSRSQKFVVMPKMLSDDPGAWGILFADIARQVAKAYAVSEPQDDNTYSEVLNRIKVLFDAEWDYPTA
jgi:hypothetical protein